jgi:predicted RNase H-like nuclease
MKTFIGIDGFRGGWVAAWIDECGNHGFDYSPTVDRLISYPHEMAMIDIPIGLPERNYRACDEQARELLGPHVFLGARRDLCPFNDPAEANMHYWADGQKGISRQLWHLRCKIREIDELMTSERQRKFRETHPELVFWRLGGGNKLADKKTEVGRRERIVLLQNQGFTKVGVWLSHRFGTGIGRDDLIDACACAVAARQAKERLPRDREHVDSRDLRMEMWY